MESIEAGHIREIEKSIDPLLSVSLGKLHTFNFKPRAGRLRSRAPNSISATAIPFNPREAGNGGVYKREDSQFYWYKFKFKGKVYWESAGKTSRRKAEADEQDRKAQVRRIWMGL